MIGGMCGISPAPENKLNQVYEQQVLWVVTILAILGHKWEFYDVTRRLENVDTSSEQVM